MKGVAGMRFRPSGPDLGLPPPAPARPVSHPKNPPVICLSRVFVRMSITSTDLLLRSVKYIRPAALSTSAISNEKFVPAVTLGMAIIAFSVTFTKLLLLSSPHPFSIRHAAKAEALLQNLVISASLFTALRDYHLILPAGVSA